jgi:hypothetical protein
MTIPTLTFRVIQLDEHPSLDPYRTSLFTAWFNVTTHTPVLGCDEWWLRLGPAIVSGAPLADWVSGSELDPWYLPDDTPDLFLDELEALVEDEEGTDLQHLSSMIEGFTE